MDEIKLKPCPFCGGKPYLDDALGSVVCPKCGASHATIMTEEEAIAAWNRRAERTCHMTNLGGLPDRLALLLCDQCGGTTYENVDGSGAPNFCPHCGVPVNEDREWVDE